VTALALVAFGRKGAAEVPAETITANRGTWRMPPLAKLPPENLSLAAKTWMGVLRLYLVVAGGMVLIRIVTLATGAG
jgi:hypothetical protein